MKLSDFQGLDPKVIGSWPLMPRVLVILVACVAILGAGFWFDTQEQMASLEGIEKKEGELKSTFEAKQSKAANLKPLKRQLVEMEQSFGALLRLLPNKTEIEGLLVDISQAGLASGLEFELFKPETETKAEFYAIQPIKLRVTGSYHEFGEFISAVSALPRIVTQHDVVIKPRKGKDDERELVMDATAKTYRYMEQDEIEETAAVAADSSSKGRRGRGGKKRKGKK
ncbi:MAG: pilus assembly protein PilO [Gammaproteobacteria bacterium]|nr:MAG: pilus assembly protein PilO [Gammaproteobacteria bacterium]